MAGISLDRLSNILQRNIDSGLMSESGDKLMNKHKMNSPSRVGGDNIFDTDDYEQDYDDSLYLSEEPEKKSNRQYNDYYDDDSVENSNLPDAIKKSLMEKKIDTSVLKEKPVTELLGLKPAQKKQRQITEERQHPYTQSVAVDYSLIKTIVKESMEEFIGKLQDSESGTLKTIGLSQGNIKLVDNKGNIYVAKLELKGNVNDKKGK